MHRALMFHSDIIFLPGITDTSSIFNSSTTDGSSSLPMRGQENGKKQTICASLMRPTVAINDNGREFVPLLNCVLMSRSGPSAGNVVAVVINDHLRQQCRGRHQTRDSPFTRAMNNLCQNPPLWLLFHMKFSLKFTASTLSSAFKYMEPGIIFSAGLCNYDIETGVLTLPDNMNALIEPPHYSRRLV